MVDFHNSEFYSLVPKSPTHTGLICVKTLEPNISSLGPFKKLNQNSNTETQIKQEDCVSSSKICKNISNFRDGGRHHVDSSSEEDRAEPRDLADVPQGVA
jgi:hypothetical protein